MSNAASPSYLEIFDFIASGTTPQAVADFRSSPEAQRRIAELIAQEKEGSLSVEEKSELDHFMDLEHILRVAKARADRSSPVALDVDEVSHRLVIERASRRCEYCLVHEDSAGFPHQVDHIISRKHGGSSGIGNLAYACVLCDRRAGKPIRFFDPQPEDPWEVTGYVHNVVFTCGAVAEPDGTVKIYWGGADSVMCAGEAKLADLVALCLEHGRPAK